MLEEGIPPSILTNLASWGMNHCLSVAWIGRSLGAVRSSGAIRRMDHCMAAVTSALMVVQKAADFWIYSL